MTEERGDKRRPRDKTQHGDAGFVTRPADAKHSFFFAPFDKMEGASVIYGRPASVWSSERHRFMSAITACPC